MAERFEWPGPSGRPWPGADEEASVARKNGGLLGWFGDVLNYWLPELDGDEEATNGEAGTQAAAGGGSGGSGGNGGGQSGGAGAPAAAAGGAGPAAPPAA